MRRPAFFADTMLGRLARWLRILGYDTAYERGIRDSDLIRRTLAEGRWVLTRDLGLQRRRVLHGRLTLIRSDHLADQLRQVAEELDLSLALRGEGPCRCTECNVPVTPLPLAEAAPLVPSYIARTQDRFVRCPGCGRIYWPGSHWARMDRILRQMTESKP